MTTVEKACGDETTVHDGVTTVERAHGAVVTIVAKNDALQDGIHLQGGIEGEGIEGIEGIAMIDAADHDHDRDQEEAMMRQSH